MSFKMVRFCAEKTPITSYFYATSFPALSPAAPAAARLGASGAAL